MVCEDDVRQFITNLEPTLRDVHPKNIINYDETSLVDDSKGKRQIFRRGSKHAERIMTTPKTTF